MQRQRGARVRQQRVQQGDQHVGQHAAHDGHVGVDRHGRLHLIEHVGGHAGEQEADEEVLQVEDGQHGEGRHRLEEGDRGGLHHDQHHHPEGDAGGAEVRQVRDRG